MLSATEIIKMQRLKPLNSNIMDVEVKNEIEYILLYSKHVEFLLQYLMASGKGLLWFSLERYKS